MEAIKYIVRQMIHPKRSLFKCYSLQPRPPQPTISQSKSGMEFKVTLTLLT